MIGSVLSDRYRLEAELGRGGMSVVYRAQDLLLNRPVAVKVLSVAGLGTAGRGRLLAEARAAARLNHPNIVSVYDAGEAELAGAGPGAVGFIVMEYVEGESLFARPPRTLHDSLAAARQICAALGHAHAVGIIHRDLKPENVLISPAAGQIKLMDFGLAHTEGAPRLTEEGTLVGTFAYLAPEMITGSAPSPQSDLYALGVMLYEWVAGGPPFTGDNILVVLSQHVHATVVPPSTRNPSVLPALETLILRLLSKNPGDRPRSAVEVAQFLDRLDADAPASGEGGGSAAPLDRIVRGRLVGRERELAEMRAHWQQAAAGEPGVLLVSGEPGIGKTRLARELATLVEVARAVVLAGECYAEGGAPYAPIAQLIQAAFPPEGRGTPPPDLPAFVLADLITLCPPLRLRFPNVAPNPPLEPPAERQRLFESFVALCAALAARMPVLLLVDDAHWADAGTLFLLHHLARRARSAKLPLLLVLIYREVELDEARALNDLLTDLNRERLAARVKLTRLSREQAEALLAAMFAEPITPDFLDGIYRETEGNPFFMEEVCKTLIEDGKLYRENGRWRRPAMSEIRVPQSVRVAIQGRVAKLPAPAQEALRLAAVLGREFDFATLLRAADLAEEALIDALEQAERAQLVTETNGRGRETFAFVHVLIPATLRESVSGLRRHRLHRRVAAALEQVHPDDFEALAHHFNEAGDETRARDYFTRAAERARRLYANDDALRGYTEALALTPEAGPERFDLLAARAQVYDLVGRRAEQRADVDALLALAEKLDDDGRRFEAALADADHAMAADMTQALGRAERAAALAAGLGDPLREGLALRRLGWAARLRGDLFRSRSVLTAAAGRFRAAGQLSEAAACLHTLSLTLYDLSEEAAAQQAVEEALALSRQAGDRRHEATSLRRLAIMLNDQRRFTEMLPLAEQALNIHRQLGDRSEEAHDLNVLGIALLGQGRFAEAETFIRESLAVAERIELRVAVSNAAANLVDLRLRQREPAGALAALDEFAAHPILAEDESARAYLVWLRAGILADLGQFAAALQLSSQAQPWADSLFGAAAKGEVAAFTARCQAELGDVVAARAGLDAALAAHADEPVPYGRGAILYEMSFVARLESEAGVAGRLESARVGIDEVVTLARKINPVHGLAYALNYAAEVRLALGEPEAALALADESFRVADDNPYEYFIRERFWYTRARALLALGRAPEAAEACRRGQALVMEIAGRLKDEALRRSWLENVRANRGLLETAGALAAEG